MGKMVFPVLLICLVLVKCETPENVQNLLDHVLSEKVYNNMIRGEFDLTQATIVNMNFSLISIDNFDEVAETLDVLGVMYLSWTDQRLTWDPAEYNNTQSLQVDQERVWRPDVVLSNPSTRLTSFSNTIVRYDQHGHAEWQIADVFKVKCPTAVTSFPFDRQTCGLLFHTRGYTPKEVNLVNQSDKIFTHFFMQNGVWNLSDTYIRRQEYTDIALLEFILVMERQSSFFIIIVCIPAMVLGLLGLFVVVIPHESGERISYAITVLLSIAVFLNVISDHLPAKSVNMASICYFLLSQLLVCATACICSIVSLRMYYNQSQAPPHWLAKLVFTLTRRRSNDKARINDGILSRPDGSEVHDPKDCKLESEADDVMKVSSDITWRDVTHLFDRISLVILPAFFVFTVIMYTYHVIEGRKDSHAGQF